MAEYIYVLLNKNGLKEVKWQLDEANKLSYVNGILNIKIDLFCTSYVILFLCT